MAGHNTVLALLPHLAQAPPTLSPLAFAIQPPIAQYRAVLRCILHENHTTKADTALVVFDMMTARRSVVGGMRLCAGGARDRSR